MKYKIKFTGYSPNGLVPIFEEGEIVNSESFTVKGLNVFIPFSDTRFFEPVKTRKFVVEVSDENMERFNFYVNDGDPAWTVTELEEEVLPYWVIEFKKQYPESAKAFSSFPCPHDLKDTFSSSKLECIKVVKHKYNVGLKEAKALVDFIWDNF